jgi:membrane protein YqaA with SNARE-associated domain
MLQRLYDWTLALAGHRHALPALAAIAFIESSIFPIPPDILIIPMILAAPTRAWRIALVATVSSVVGGLFGYLIGAFLFDAVAQPILAFYGYEAQFASFQARYNEWGAWIVAGAGFTPFPYKVITIASGATGLDPTVFIIASILSRGARFFLIAALLWRFGAPIRGFLERYLALLTVLFFVLLFGGFVAAKAFL